MIFADDSGGGGQLGTVVVHVGDEAVQVAPPEAAAVAAKVNGVEVEAEVGQMVSEMRLKEVVVPPVYVQYGPAMPLGRSSANEGGHHFDVRRLAGSRSHIRQQQVGTFVAVQEVRMPQPHLPRVTHGLPNVSRSIAAAEAHVSARGVRPAGLLNQPPVHRV